MKPKFIAEVKTCSPFGYQSRHSWRLLCDLAIRIGDGISVHTDPRFGGSFNAIIVARALTDKFILAKGFHESDDDIRRALDLGANAVLVVGRIPSPKLADYCWIEPYDLAGLREIPNNLVAVWNARNLKTGLPKKETWMQARRAFNGQLCQASFIKLRQNVAPDAEFFIVGEHLQNFV